MLLVPGIVELTCGCHLSTSMRLLLIGILQAHGPGHHHVLCQGRRELTHRGKRMRQWPV